MARLPQPGSDNGTWGDILNEFLSQSLAPSGELKPESVGATQLQDNSVTNSAIAPNTITSTELASNAVTAAIIADGSITETLLDTSLQTKVNATAPVSSVNTKTGVVSLDKSDIGLANVDNTSDAQKPISTATQTALDGKVSTSSGANILYGTDASGNQSTPTRASTVTNNTIAQRTSTGTLKAATPAISDDLTTKSYVDAADALKANDTSVVHNTGTETVAGQKTFTSRLIVGDGTANVGVMTQSNGYNGMYNYVYSDTSNAYNIFFRSKGTVSAPTQLTTDSYLGEFGFRATNETGAFNNQDAVRFGAKTEEDVKSTSQKSAMIVWTAPDYQISPIERFRISGTGNISIGRGADNGSLFSVARNGGLVRTGTVDTNGTTTLNGTNTMFTNTFRVGDSITVDNETSRTITAVNSDTSLTVNTAFTTTATGVGYIAATNYNLFRVQTNGNIGINQANPQSRLHFGASTNAADGIQFGTDTNLYRSAADTLRTDDTLSVGTSIMLPQNATTVSYNTTDQTTNFERVRSYWNSNAYTILSEAGGTGTIRDIRLVSGVRTFNIRSSGSTTTGFIEALVGTSSTGYVGVSLNTGFWNASSGVNPIVTITPNISQSGTAGYTMLQVNPTETSTGSGAKLLADFQVGGVSKMRIDNTGSQTLSFGATSSIFNTSDETTNYERVRQFWTGNTYYIRAEAGGTGIQRPIVISGTNRNFTIGSGLNFYDFNTSTGSNSGVTGININGSWGSSAAVTVGMSITPTVAHTSTAGYTMLLINPTETSTGSGTRLLADFQVGGVSKAKIDTTGVITAAAGTASGNVVTIDGTQTLTNKTFSGPSFSGNTVLPQGSALHLYNTVDQTTNYERARHYWNSNTYVITTDFGGTGSARPLQIVGAGRVLDIGKTTAHFDFASSTSSTIPVVRIIPTLTTTTSTAQALSITPSVNQSGTAGYTALLVNSNETAIGSGTRLLADFQLGGVSKAKIDTTGVITAAAGTSSGNVVTVDGVQTLTNKTFSDMNFSGNSAIPQNGSLLFYNTVDQTTNYERARMYWSSNQFIIEGTEAGGTGVSQRSLSIRAQGKAFTIAGAGGIFDMSITTGGSGAGLRVTGTNSASSGTPTGITILNTMNQSGTAGYTSFLVSTSETSTGSGTKLLADFQLAGVSKVSITNLGQLKLAASTTSSATMNIPTGTAPSSPATGDIYSDGTHIYCYLAGTWKQLD